MNDVDREIDAMNREQLSVTIAKSYAKRARVTVKHTTGNQKFSLERLDEIYAVYERLLKDILKIWVRDEKVVRLKYLKPMSDQRRKTVVHNLHSEMELVCRQIEDEWRSSYESFGQGHSFDEKLNKTRKKQDLEIEKKTLEIQNKINSELEKNEKVEPKELVQRYGIDEPTLIDLRIIDPLQKIDSALKQWPEGFREVAQGVHETISLCKKYYQKGALKNIVLTLETLVNQGSLEMEVRNQEIIQKSWARLENLMKLAPESEERLSKIQPLNRVFDHHES